ncbi:MAG: hypothetical protein AB9903_28755 [Vulcanimicrobiota bacterium]
MDDMAEIGRAFQEIYEKEVRLPLKRILKIWFMRKLRMSGLPTAGVNLDEGEVFKVLETNIQRDRDRLREEARREGREEGMEKGRVEGMQAVARRMASMGEEIAKVALFTELSEEEIRALLNGSDS